MGRPMLPQRSTVASPVALAETLQEFLWNANSPPTPHSLEQMMRKGCSWEITTWWPFSWGQGNFQVTFHKWFWDCRTKMGLFKRSHFPWEEGRFWFFVNEISVVGSASAVWFLGLLRDRLHSLDKLEGPAGPSYGEAQFINPIPVLITVFIKDDINFHWMRKITEVIHAWETRACPLFELCHLSCFAKGLCLSVTKLLWDSKSMKIK